GRAELGVPPVGRRAADLDGDGVARRVLHLRGDGPLPDQLVQPELVTGQPGLGGRTETVTRRADRLVRLLRVLDLARVGARLRGQDRKSVVEGKDARGRGGRELKDVYGVRKQLS